MVVTDITPDYALLKSKVQEIVDLYLYDISEDGIKGFLRSVKSIAKDILESYYISVDDSFMDGDGMIKGAELRDKFADFHSGYRARMAEWVSNLELDIPVPALALSSIGLIGEKAKLTLGLGSLAAVGLAVFTKSWIGILAETMVVGTAIHLHKQEEMAHKLHVMQTKENFVNAVINAVEQLFKDAEHYSGTLLKDIGVK